MPVAQISESGQHLLTLMRIEPLEIFVIAFDKDCRSRDRPPLGKPQRKVPRAIISGKSGSCHAQNAVNNSIRSALASSLLYGSAACFFGGSRKTFNSDHLIKGL